MDLICGEDKMKILVLFEYSGIVRDAFTAKGHEAISIDLLETESPGEHICGDIDEMKVDYSEMMKLPKKERERIFNMPPSFDRGKLRSRFYSGIADAMAAQWGAFMEI